MSWNKRTWIWRLHLWLLSNATDCIIQSVSWPLHHKYQDHQQRGSQLRYICSGVATDSRLICLSKFLVYVLYMHFVINFFDMIAGFMLISYFWWWVLPFCCFNNVSLLHLALNHSDLIFANVIMLFTELESCSGNGTFYKKTDRL